MRRRTGFNRRRGTTAVAAGLIAVTACSARPAVEAERSDAIDVRADAVSDDLAATSEPNEPSQTLPPMPPLEVQPVEEPPASTDPVQDDWAEDDWTEDDWDFEPLEVPAELQRLLPSSELLDLPWHSFGPAYFYEGFGDDEAWTDCDAASRIVAHYQHDSALVFWEDSDGAFVGVSAYDMGNSATVNEAFDDLAWLHINCPTFRWLDGSIDVTVHQTRQVTDGVAYARWTADDGVSEQFAAVADGQYLVIVQSYRFGDEPDQPDLELAMKTLLDEVLYLTGTSSSADDPQTEPVDSDNSESDAVEDEAEEAEPPAPDSPNVIPTPGDGSALLTSSDLGSEWTVTENELVWTAAPEGDDLCGLNQVPEFLGHAQEKFVELHRSSDGLTAEHVVATFDSEADADDAVTRLALLHDDCIDQYWVDDATMIVYEFLDVAGADRSVALHVDNYGLHEHILLVRVDEYVSLTWSSDSSLVSSGDVAWIGAATAARLVSVAR